MVMVTVAGAVHGDGGDGGDDDGDNGDDSVCHDYSNLLNRPEQAATPMQQSRGTRRAG